MIDENDLSQERKHFYSERGRKAVAKFEGRNIHAVYAPTKEDALSEVIGMIPEGAKVVKGDSMSVDQVGVIDELRKRNRNEVSDPFERDSDGRTVLQGEQRRRVQKEAFSADVFITGANAITLDGKIVNTDAVGNRVAPIIFGPDKVILVIGANKIVKDLDGATRRVHEIAAPINAKRHALKHHNVDFGELPCVITGSCTDCNHDWRICRFTVIIEGSMFPQKGRINLVIVGEELGI
jgi:L-lactate utilization protein LutB